MCCAPCFCLQHWATSSGTSRDASADTSSFELVQQHYIRAEPFCANVRLVDARTQIPLAQASGGGDVASADGIRFVVPVRTLMRVIASTLAEGEASPTTTSPLTSSLAFMGWLFQAPCGFFGRVGGIVGTTHQLRPREIMTDTSGYSGIVFGVFWLLGYQFSPRLADAGAAIFCGLPRADYGVLNRLARQRVKTELIEAAGMTVRVAGSLKLGTVSALEIIACCSGVAKSTLGKPLAIFGRWQSPYIRSLHR